MKISIIYDYNDIKNSKYLNKIKELKVETRKCIRTCLKEENIQSKHLEVYIKYTNNIQIQEINKKYRNIDKPTDVLSFPMYEKVDLLDEIEKYNSNNCDIPITLGDIVISIEKIQEQSKEYGHTFKRELMYLTTHSMFHLLGYDHIEEKDKKIMRPKEDSVMEKLKIVK